VTKATTGVSIDQAEHLLRAGEVVALPTETVYGLGADATHEKAVARVFALKGRPATNPLIVHVASVEIARRLSVWDDRAGAIFDRFAPGPISVILRHRPGGPIVPAVRAGLDTVAFRIPSHSLMLELLRRFDGAVAAPSANRSNRVSPTRPEHVIAELGEAVPLLDGGVCEVGLESTVIDLTTPTPTILRPGAVTLEQLSGVIGTVRRSRDEVGPDEPARSPGQQRVHYAPSKPAWRIEPGTPIPRGASFIRFALDAESAMRDFYARLRDADASPRGLIVIEMPPDEPQWTALRDRIERATRPLDPGP
jgi:L-threonylcarbamoyladenylate synthase